eukprot:345205_1
MADDSASKSDQDKDRMDLNNEEQVYHFEERATNIETEHKDEDTHDGIDNINPYKLHIFMDKYPICSFCIALMIFLLCGVIIVLVSQTDTVIRMSSQVPMYIRDNKAYEARDALVAGQSDASYEPKETSTT